MIFKTAKYITGLLTIATLALPAQAAQEAGTAGAQVLTIVPDARTTGMGETFVAVADDAQCLSYNPAGLGLITHNEVPMANNRWLGDMFYQQVGIAFSLRDIRTANMKDMGTLAFSFLDLNSGAITGRDAAGAATGNFTARDQVITAAYGRPLLESRSLGKLLAGGSAKFLVEDIGGETFSNRVFDAGLLWQMPWHRLSAGLAAQNIGNLSYGAGANQDAPTTLRAGLACRLFHDDLLVAADYSKLQGAATEMHAGTEYRLLDILALRLGYQGRASNEAKLSCGFGLSLKQLDVMFFFAKELNLDYSFIPYDDLGGQHRLSLVLKLGAD
jgi:hypothetical protein